MVRKYAIVWAGLLVVGALAVAMTGTVLAQEDSPSPAPKPFGERWWGHGRGRGLGRGFGGQIGLEAAADVLGMTADELATQLWGGETLADLAEKASGVDLQDVRDAIVAANEAATRRAIEQAVQDGVFTGEHADWLLEGLDNGYWGGQGFGDCPGRGGFGHRGIGRFPGGNTGFGGFGRFPGRNILNTMTNDA